MEVSEARIYESKIEELRAEVERLRDGAAYWLGIERARAEAAEGALERLRVGVQLNTEGVLRDDPDTGHPELFGWELRDLRLRLESLLEETA